MSGDKYMSLREEISRAIHTCIANPNQRVNSDKVAFATIAVLSIIEKRIDELLQDESNIYCPKCNDVSVEVFRDLLK